MNIHALYALLSVCIFCVSCDIQPQKKINVEASSYCEIVHLDTIIDNIRITYSIRSSDTINEPVICDISFSNGKDTLHYYDTIGLRFHFMGYRYGFENKIMVLEDKITSHPVIRFQQGFLLALWSDGYLSPIWLKPDFKTMELLTSSCPTGCVSRYDDSFLWVNADSGFYLCPNIYCDYENLINDQIYCSREIDHFELVSNGKTAELKSTGQKKLQVSDHDYSKLDQSDSSFWISLAKLTKN